MEMAGKPTTRKWGNCSHKLQKWGLCGGEGVCEERGLCGGEGVCVEERGLCSGRGLCGGRVFVWWRGTRG